MADPRASTVYDYAALRVHPDGSRVRAPQRTSVNTWDNSDTPSSSAFAAPPMRTAASVVQDARAQWIARDAGGSARIPLTMGRRRRSARTVREGEREVEEDIARGMAAADEALRFDDEDEDDDEFNPREGISADSAQEGQGKTQKRGVKRKRTADTRPAKRARFAADMAYLASPPAPPAATQFANAHPGADDVTQTYANPQATAGETSQLSGPSPVSGPPHTVHAVFSHIFIPHVLLCSQQILMASMNYAPHPRIYLRRCTASRLNSMPSAGNC